MAFMAFIFVIRCLLSMMSVSWFHWVIVCSSLSMSWGSVQSMLLSSSVW